MIAITGSNGFVGRSLIACAHREGVEIRAISREDYDKSKAYEGCDVVVHLAGLAHRKSATLEQYMAVNCDLAMNCAVAAKSAGVRRFIYISSSKALRGFSENERPLHETEQALPSCDYGRAKLAAEERLLFFQKAGALNITILRPALVIGSPPKANLQTLAKVAQWSCKFPISSGLLRWGLSSFHSSKSFTSLGNLCSAILFLAQSSQGDGEIFHIVDDQAISTSTLFEKMENFSQADKGHPDRGTASQHQGIPKFPVLLFGRLLKLIGMGQTFESLALPFVLDGTKIQRELGWKPQPLIDVELQRIMAKLPISEDG